MQAALIVLLAVLSLLGALSLLLLAVSQGRAELARALAPRRNPRRPVPMTAPGPDLAQRVRSQLPARAPPDPSIRTRPAQPPAESRE